MAQKKEMVEVTIRQLNYPEATMWAVVPKQKWNQATTMKGILNLLEKQVSGHSLEEEAKRLEQENKLLERDSVLDQEEQIAERLEILEAEGNLKITVEPASEESESMTPEELSEAEQNLFKRSEAVWDETPM